MKKIILASAITISTMFALDITSAATTVGSSLGITAESIGTKLADIVKEKAPETAAQAKVYCTQASTYKSFVGIADDGMMAKAIDICAEKSSEGLEDTVKDAATSAISTASATSAISDVKESITTQATEAVSEAKETVEAEKEPSLLDSVKGLFGN